MKIALIAHDKRKEMLVHFCVTNCSTFARHTLCATAVTGKLISDATGLEIYRFMSGVHGGDQEIAARIANKEIDVLFFFRDPSLNEKDKFDSATILRLCDVHNIPVATNLVMANVLIKALDRGELEKKDPPVFTGTGRRRRNIY